MCAENKSIFSKDEKSSRSERPQLNRKRIRDFEETGRHSWTPLVHSQTRVYPEGIPYITKLLRKNGYLA